MTTFVRRNNTLPTTLNNIFDDLFSKDVFDWNNKNFTATGSTLPSVNVKETESGYSIELAAPGMKKEDFKIELDKNTLTISAEKKAESEERDKNGKYTRKEFSYETFSRSFTLPANTVESDKIDASYKDGILQINVPKKEIAKQQATRNISIN